MMERLLELLRKESGQVISGALLSRDLGVSRTAVWKKVRRLRDQGYRIDSVPSAGYRLISAPDRLFPAEIRNGLKAGAFGRDIHYLENTDSTNRVAADMARQGAFEGTLVVADAQTQGKGRLGRSWISPARCNLYFSLILRPGILPSGIPQVTLMASVSLSESLSRRTQVPVRIKWPNDLWAGGGKIGGILTEMSADMDQVGYVILGIGVNVNMSGEALPEDLRGKATSLFLETGRSFGRAALLQGLLSDLERDYGLFCSHGFKPFRERWMRASMTIGHPVHVRMPHRELTGRALEIGETGHLRVETGDGTVEDVVCGDVMVMPDQRVIGDPPEMNGEVL